MPDIQDMVTRAIQSYANKHEGPAPFEPNHPSRLLLLALSEAISAHIIAELKLEQEWAVGTTYSGKLFDIDCSDTDPQVVMDRLESIEEMDQKLHTPDVRRFLVTRLLTDWAEEDDPEIDEHLVDLVVQNDG